MNLCQERLLIYEEMKEKCRGTTQRARSWYPKSLFCGNSSVFVYFYEQEILIKISTTGWKSQKGGTGTLIKFHMMGDRVSF